MKKLIAAVAVALGVSAMAYDNYFYWMVDGTGDYTWAWTGARISDNNGATYLALTDRWYDSIGTVASKANAEAGVYASYATLGSTYLVELLWDDTAVAIAEIASGTVSDRSTTDLTMEPKDPFRVSSFTATGVVPEPTSGLLSLFGLALLAIRRKKVA